jgi:hypothetical protein
MKPGGQSALFAAECARGTPARRAPLQALEGGQAEEACDAGCLQDSPTASVEGACIIECFTAATRPPSNEFSQHTLLDAPRPHTDPPETRAQDTAGRSPLAAPPPSQTHQHKTGQDTSTRAKAASRAAYKANPTTRIGIPTATSQQASCML